MEEELLFELTVDGPHQDGSVTYTINEGEADYVLQQIKYNQPFVILVEDEVHCYSPSQCYSIKIKPVK